MRRASLRLRLFALILIPLVFMAVLLGAWRFNAAQKTAEELFDRSLLAAALAISRDVAVSDGDLLSPATSDLISDISGGDVFYHVTGPGGIYITGYAYPPSTPANSESSPYAPQFFRSVYRDEGVQVVRITERITQDELSGDATITAWQRLADRAVFARQLALRAATLIGALLVTLALVVWFGVSLGLRPLIDLQDAIDIRSPDDLSRIKRAVPDETRGIVRTLNRLFAQVESSMTAHKVFISDAAHQLRNPAAAVQSMAEAVRDAPSEETRRARLSDLVTAAKASGRIADQLLSLDRLQQNAGDLPDETHDLVETLREICAELGPTILLQGIEFEFNAPDTALPVRADKLFLAEAIKNLVDNALKHGGDALTEISVHLRAEGGDAVVTVRDDGKGLAPEQSEVAFRRFSQVEPSNGSGLGLAIAQSVSEKHGGSLSIDRVNAGASLTIRLPLAQAADRS
ncbi:sensor histidine kinase [Pacificoceanicola onchidii]|uniref:sensor histidine kinase n=1 Tax=Pacificoceanicola onchidii TaxID=2562685 RepID=UPI0010A6B254|nr:sensor histidine kinase [Pacificoceanicola onchidii]